MDTDVVQIGGGAFLNGRLYVPGGFDSGFFSVFNRMQIYSASTNTWSTDGEIMPLPHLLGLQGWADAAVCAGKRRVYVVNGVDGLSLYSALQIYDTKAPAGARWTVGPNPATTTTNVFFSQASGCAVIGQNLYLFAGSAAIGDPNDPGLEAAPSGATWVLDLRTWIWRDTGHVMNTARFWHGYAGASDRAVVAGGTNDPVNLLPTSTAEVFTPAAGWTSLPDMPEARLGLGMGIVGGGAPRAMVFGGRSSVFGSTFASTLACTLPTCSSWTDMDRNLTTPRSFFAWGSAPNNLYVAGGQDSFGVVLNTAEKAA
jgi:hypothetical protein